MLLKNRTRHCFFFFGFPLHMYFLLFLIRKIISCGTSDVPVENNLFLGHCYRFYAIVTHNTRGILRPAHSRSFYAHYCYRWCIVLSVFHFRLYWRPQTILHICRCDRFKFKLTAAVCKRKPTLNESNETRKKNTDGHTVLHLVIIAGFFTARCLCFIFNMFFTLFIRMDM